MFIAPYQIIPTHRFQAHFLGEHWLDLKKSGLDDDTICEAGIYSLRPGDIEQFTKANRVTSCLCFPYQGGAFARVKLFPPLGSQKYSQPRGTSARLYMPFGVKDGPLFLIEGEKKALAAWQSGINAIGIGGVWSWVTRGEPISDLDQVAFDGRELVIIGDSDIWRRPDLLQALYALGSMLAEVGASVSFLEIPDSEDGQKQGLDDYLVSGGDFDALDCHLIGSHRLSRHRPWYQRWRVGKAMARLKI